MATPAEMFSALVQGNPLPAGYWRVAHDEKGRSLLHVAAAYGRLDSLWMLLETCSILAATPDYDMLLPEDMAANKDAQLLCKQIRIKYFLQHTAL